MPKLPKLVIEGSAAGVEAITIRVAPGEREEGLVLLERALPGLQELDRSIRQSRVSAEDRLAQAGPLQRGGA